MSAGVAIEIAPFESIDLEAAIPCEYLPAATGPACGKPAAARVRIARGCCGINNWFFICAEDLAKAKEQGVFCRVHPGASVAWKET